jgi:predicted O-linked N-acetylglucosamine transferase (SPINDLY family)
MTERLYTERLVRLPEIYLSWQPPPDAPDPGPLPARTTGRVTFASFNSCYKITPAVVGLWSRILHEVADSRLLLFTVPSGRAQSLLRERFAALGIRADRLEFRGRTSLEAFMAAHCEVDVALDCFPYHGTTTTCSTLWMGVPLVCLAGSAHVSRVGATMLHSVGLPSLVVETADEYVSTACRLARDFDALTTLRASLRERMRASPLTDGRAHAHALDRAYREMWRTWCSSTIVR